MIVGVLKRQEQVEDQSFHISDKVQINDNTATFTFTTVEGKPIHNLKNWYNDPTMVGKHFLVYSAAEPRIKRQYTICNSMRQDVKVELLTLADGVIQNNPTNFDYTIMLG